MARSSRWQADAPCLAMPGPLLASVQYVKPATDTLSLSHGMQVSVKAREQGKVNMNSIVAVAVMAAPTTAAFLHSCGTADAKLATFLWRFQVSLWRLCPSNFITLLCLEAILRCGRRLRSSDVVMTGAGRDRRVGGFPNLKSHRQARQPGSPRLAEMRSLLGEPEIRPSHEQRGC